jgi:hypothetical protein
LKIIEYFSSPAYKTFRSSDRNIAVTACVGSPVITVGGMSDPRGDAGEGRKRERRRGRWMKIRIKR